MHVLNVAFGGRTVWGTGNPEVEILVTTCFEVQGVVAGMKVGELVEQMESGFGVKFGVCTREMTSRLCRQKKKYFQNAETNRQLLTLLDVW